MQKKQQTKKNSQKRNISRAKKNRVYIPTNSIITFCAVVVVVCTVFLLTNIFLTENKKNDVEVDAKKETEFHNEIASPRLHSEQAIAQQEAELSMTKENETTAVLPTPPLPATLRSRLKAHSATTATTTENNKTKTQQPAERAMTKTTETTTPAQRPADYGFPVAKNDAKLAIIFDDGGQNLNQLEKCVSLPFKVTVAVLPRLPHSKEAAERVRKSGNELILHQPMQALNLNVSPGFGAITPEMSLSEIDDVLRENIAEIAPISGINNHEGSLICEDEAKIGEVLKFADSEGLYFVDSRTTSQTRVPQASMGMNIGYYERNIFLDNTKNRDDVIAEIKKGLEIANKTGSCIMIGHVFSSDFLPQILLELYPVLSKKGYKFVTVSKSGAMKKE